LSARQATRRIAVQRLKTRAQFEAVMAGSTVSRTAHFALHRRELDAPQASATGPEPAGPASAGNLQGSAAGPGSAGPKALFAVREAWIGALVPKRWAKRAVTRNAIKRQIYTVSLAFEPRLPAAAHVVRLRAGFDRARFTSATSDALKQAVRGELHELFARAAS
jgi:ribonuclease P protein component